MFQLRPYQREAIDNIKQQWKTVPDTMITAATGAGKTQVFLGLLAEELRDHPSRRALIIAHRKELIDQPIERLAQFWPELYDDAGIVMANQNESSKRIVVATVQTLNGNGRLDDILSHGPIDYLVIDEAHHAVAETYKNVVAVLKAANPGMKHLGVTATPIRADDVGLREVYKTEAAHYGIKEMVRMNYLAPPRWLAIQTGISLAGVPKSGSGEDRDYTRSGLRDVFETSNCFDLVVESHKKYAAERLAICFTASVEGAYNLAETFNEAGIPAAAADGTTPKDERKAILDRFRTGDLEVICNVALWTEGLDLPEISCVHMVRPTQSDAYYMQAIGRGLRLFPGKDDALILDYCPAETRNIVMLGDVLGLEVRKEAYVRDDADEGEVIGGFTFDGEVTWMEGDPMEIVSRQLDYLDQSPWKWQRPGKSSWMILGLGPGTDDIDRTLALSPASDKMELWAIWKEKDDRWHKASRLQVGDFENLSQVGEAIADRRGVPALAKKKQRWRTQPPSPGQLKFAKNLGIDTTGKSKGDIADAITYKLAMNALRRNGAMI